MADTTIGSGGDEPTLPDWEAALQALGTITGTETGLLKNQAHDATVFSGVATSGAGKVVLTCEPGASFRDNMDPGTDALKYDTTKGAYITTNSATYCIDASSFSMEIEGVQFEHTGATAYGVRMVGGSGNTFVVKNCIFRLASTTFNYGVAITCNGSAGGSTVESNLIQLDSTVICIGIYAVFTNAVVENNTIVAVSGTGHIGALGEWTANALNLINNYFGGMSTDLLLQYGSASATGTDNATSKASSTLPSTNLDTSKAASDQFVNAANDFRHKTGAALIGAGDSSGASTDIYGRTRTGAKDIGADQYQAAASGLAANPIFGGGSAANPLGGYVL